MKRFSIFILLILAAFASMAQGQYWSVRQGRFLPITNAADTAATVANDGRIWYDFVTDEYRGIKGGVAFSFGSGSGGGDFWPLSGSAAKTAPVNITGDFDVTLTGKHIFTPNATHEGVNVGTVASNPSAPASGAMWVNSTTNRLYERIGANNFVSLNILDATITNLQVPFFTGVTGQTTSDSDFTFTGGNTLTTPILSTVGSVLQLTTNAVGNSVVSNRRFFAAGGSATLACLNISGVASDPSSIGDGDMFRNSANFALGYRDNSATFYVNKTPVASAVADRIPVISSTGANTTTDSDLTFTGGNTLNTANLTVSSLTSGRLPIVSTGGSIIDDADLLYNAAGNTLTTNNVTATTFRQSGLTSSVGVLYNTGIANGFSNEDAFNYAPSTNTLTVEKLIIAPGTSGTQGNVTPGIYTPTFTNVSNASLLQANPCNYIRVADMAQISGNIVVECSTDNAPCTFRLNLPISSDFTDADECSGTFNGMNNLPNAVGVILGQSATNDVLFQFHNTGGSSASWNLYFQFMYQIL